ncbi:polyketide cyclase [Mycobacterium dioxanotrophicus]|uniref:Polyketide cyclase n=1 Tax=Mycobacterium dioxanotrophicus TaxID=482462 RepID=A0A1Y0CGT1_9MYCO|nr:polyketide cyclase [Mycobacterium dioxanotrophicus]
MVPPLEFTDSVHVSASPEDVYTVVSDVTRTGEWSPVCKECWWDEGSGPKVGAWFTGRNVTPEREWQTRSQVVVAEPGREFAWEVNDGWVRWGYAMAPEDGGTRLTQSWVFLPRGLAGFRERYGVDADAQIAARSDAALSGIPVTLAAIKAVIERA